MIELEQLVGQRAGRNGLETISHPMDRIMLDGREVGTIAHIDGATCLFKSPHLPEKERAEIRDAVAELRKDTPWPGVAERTSAPPIVPEELQEDPVEDEEDE